MMKVVILMDVVSLFFSLSLMRPSGENDSIIDVQERNEWFDEDEMALRFYRNIGSAEVAAYYFNGYWKTPEGQDSVTGNYIFPKLQVYGASFRTPIASGIMSMEIGYYDSEDDKGDDPYIRNNEFRYLIGYEQEVFKNFTTGFQYYGERMDDYRDYKVTLPIGMPVKDRTREVWTLRLTQMLMKQKLILSLFNYYSPTDDDGYIRPKITYKPNDKFSFEVGGNIFWGKEDDLTSGGDEQTTFFGQLEDNSNIFGAVRYNF